MGLPVVAPQAGTHKDAGWCGRGRAPPSAFEPLGLEAEGAPASPVLARETRQNKGRGGREERDGLRRGAAAVLLLPGHPAGADTGQVLACACGERRSHRLGGVAEVESGGSGACSTHADFTKARHPSQRKPNPSKPNEGKGDQQKTGEVTESVGGSRPPSPR